MRYEHRKMRADFEAWWYAPEQRELRMSCAPEWGYKIWKTSREEMVITIPPTNDCISDDTDRGYQICHDMVRLELENQGLNYHVKGSERWGKS